MLVNESLIDLVGRFALKRFQFDSYSHIKADCYLEADDSKLLAPIVLQRYGKNLSSLDVSQIILEAQSMRYVDCDKLLLYDMTGGTIIDLLLDDGQKMKLLYLGGIDFCLLHDSADMLKPMDTLESLSLRIDAFSNAYFRILRNGKPFPDEKKLFLCHINKIEIERGCIRMHSPQTKQEEEKTSESKVYAWEATNGLYFSQENLTENTDAFFVIDVENMQFGVNGQYNKSLSLYRDLGSIMQGACNVSRQGKGLQTIAQGCISLYEHDFVITKKAEVGV